MTELMSEQEARDLAEANLDNVIETIDVSNLTEDTTHYSGKVRENFTRGDVRAIIVTDKVSAMDKVWGTAPFKGQVLNSLAQWWFDKTSHLAPNHVNRWLSSIATLVDECEAFPVEMVLRDYNTGSSETSIWRHYAADPEAPFCGHILPPGMTKHQKLYKTLLTPTTKGKKDANITDIEAMRLLPVPADQQPGLWNSLYRQVHELFWLGRDIAAERGLILVDTKYELGRRRRDSKIVFIDEIHTPDSSRFWLADEYETRMAEGKSPASLSKEDFRQRLEERGYHDDPDSVVMTTEDRIRLGAIYINLFQQVTGQRFVPDTVSVEARAYKPLVELGMMKN